MSTNESETDFAMTGQGHGWPIKLDETVAERRRSWLAVVLVLSGVFLVVGVAILLVGAARRARGSSEE